MFTGLCAFPLTPFNHHVVDETAFAHIVTHLVDAAVDSLGVLGSTGSYAYLSREQRTQVVRQAKSHAGSVPLMVGIGAVGTDQVLRLADDAQRAGANALLLPVMAYQPLSDEEILTFYQTVCRHVSVPVCVYDNPVTTHISLSDELKSAIAALPGIASIKIPGPASHEVAQRVQSLRRQLPDGVSIGISGDACAADGLKRRLCSMVFRVRRTFSERCPRDSGSRDAGRGPAGDGDKRQAGAAVDAVPQAWRKPAGHCRRSDDPRYLR